MNPVKTDGVSVDRTQSRSNPAKRAVEASDCWTQLLAASPTCMLCSGAGPSKPIAPIPVQLVDATLVELGAAALALSIAY